MTSTAFLPGDRVAWYLTYVGRIYSGAVEVVATSADGDVARVRVEGTGELTVVECERLSLVPDSRPAAVEAALSLVGLLAEVRAALAANDPAENAMTLASVEAGLARLLATGPKEVAR